MKRILLVTSGYKHTLYNSLIDYPPNGMRFDYNKKDLDAGIEYAHKKSFIARVTKTKIPFLPLNYYKNYFIRNFNDNDYDYLFTSGFIPFTNKKWISDCEHVGQYTGYSNFNLSVYKNQIKKYILKDNCKAIFSWTQKGVDTFHNYFNDKKIDDKVHFLPITQKCLDINRNYNKDNINFIFISSINLPFDYKIKGGEIALEAFDRISNKYDNIKLYVRSSIPNHIKKKYINNNKIIFIENILSKQLYHDLLMDSDVLLFPAFHTPGVIFIEMMKYGIPIVTSSVWANEEIVKDGQNGKVITHSVYEKLEDKNHLPLWNEYKRYYKERIINKLSKDYSKAIEQYIINTNIIENHGKKGNDMFINGRYSLKNRNYILTEIDW
ncbi:MAG: glycosyltransferase [Candidatus Thermoplasmatota archaeon]|nr:glycosyltransferase [Candidatus Thermoplasmatota archaeon]